MSEIKIPRTLEELAGPLHDLHRLLTAKQWDRAAIVYAFTEVQTNRGRGVRPPVPEPKVNLNDFAALGFTGLTTTKAVRRYRRAWEFAIDRGWAAVVQPGDITTTPEHDFPSWEAMLPEYFEEEENEVPEQTPEPTVPIRGVLAALDALRKEVLRCTEWVERTELTDERREIALELTDDIGDALVYLRQALTGERLTVKQHQAAQTRWKEFK